MPPTRPRAARRWNDRATERQADANRTRYGRFKPDAPTRYAGRTKQAEENYEQAKAQADRDYEETTAAVAGKSPLTAEEEVELTRLICRRSIPDARR